MSNPMKEFSRVAETSTSTGTGDLTLAGAISQFRAFSSVLSNSETCIVVVTKDLDWEVVRATYSTAGNSLARTQVYASTNAGAAVNWGAGDKVIRMIKPGWSDLDAAGRASLFEMLASMSEVTVASAATTDVLGTASAAVNISGTTTITSLGTGANKIRFVRMSGALVLTHNATSLILPGATNVTTAAGDTFIVISDGSSNARVYGYQRASGVDADTASTTDQLTGTDVLQSSTPDSVAALWEKGADVASAATISLGEGGFFHVTGTTTITDIDFAVAKDGRRAWLEFDAALVLTHNATTLNLPGGASITTAAGDRAEVIQDSSDNIHVLSYIKASGRTVLAASLTQAGDIEIATTTETLTGTDDTRAVSPDGLAALWEKGSAIASAATISIGEGGFAHVTGTTTIFDIDFATAKDGRMSWLEFDGTLLLTHNATTLNLPGGASITTAAGDRALVVQDSSDNIHVLSYVRANGKPVSVNSDYAFTAAQTITVSTAVDPLTLVSTDATAAIGPLISLYRNSPSPAANDEIGGMTGSYESSTGVQRTAGWAYWILDDPTNGAEDTTFSIWTHVAGAGNNAMYITQGVYMPGESDMGIGTLNYSELYEAGHRVATRDQDNNFTAQQSSTISGGSANFVTSNSTANAVTLWGISTENSASDGPRLILDRRGGAGSANDVLGKIIFMGRDTADAADTYADIQLTIVDPTAGSEDAKLSLRTNIAGAMGSRMEIGAGVYHSSATGGDKGANTINYGTIYENNVRVAVLGASQTFTAAQFISYSASASNGLTVTQTDDGQYGSFVNLAHDTASPAAGDNNWRLFGHAKNSAAADIVYASMIHASLVDPTAGSEDTATIFHNYVAGTSAERMRIGGGVYHGSVTGGDKGNNTINFGVVYQNNHQVATVDQDNAFTAAQTITLSSSFATPLTLVGTNADNSGVYLSMYKNSASPAASDTVAVWAASARDSAANVGTIAEMLMLWVDPTSTSEDSRVSWSTFVAGAYATRMNIDGGVYHPSATGGDKGNNTINFGTVYENNHRVATIDQNNSFTAAQTITITTAAAALTMTSTDAGASVGPWLYMKRESASPAANDGIGYIILQGRDTTGVDTTYVDFFMGMADPTNGSEDGTLSIRTTAAGTLSDRVVIAGGLYHTLAAGGDKGNNTINFGAVYDDNTLLTSAPASEEFWETGDITVQAWDAWVPNSRQHYAARYFHQMVLSGFDPRDPIQFVQKFKTDEVLPGMPTKDKWVHGRWSIGELASYKWLALDIVGVALSSLTERVTVNGGRLQLAIDRQAQLQSRIADLEARVTSLETIQ